MRTIDLLERAHLGQTHRNLPFTSNAFLSSTLSLPQMSQ